VKGVIEVASGASPPERLSAVRHGCVEMNSHVSDCRGIRRGCPGNGDGRMKFDVLAEPIGIMGTGSNLFRCGIVHSSGVIYLGTYGPQPAIVWKYEPKVGRLQEIGRPGEYQLDSMVEAPNGVVYIGTAYEAVNAVVKV